VTAATIIIPMLPPRECSPNWHGPWRKRATAVKAFREAAGWATVAALGGDPFLVAGSSGFVAMDVEIAWCCRRRALDDDNAWASMKAARDGLADVLFGGEDRYIVQGQLTQVRGEGVVTVTLRGAS
jgi:hypothetical protein